MGQKLTAKNKIIVLAISWLLITLVMFFFLFKIMDGKNQLALNDMAKDRQDLVTLEAENLSFKQAQNDIDKMAKMDMQPKDFFSKDITLVKEIQTLENLDGKFNTKVEFSGVSGIVAQEPGQAGIASNLVYVQYSLTINGLLPDVVRLLQVYENLSFITKVNQITVTSTGDGKVNATVGSGFYVESN